MDETTFLVALLDPASVTGASITPTEIESGIDNDWNGSAEKVFGGGYATKAPTPTIVDIRNMTRNKAARYDLSSGDLIVVYQESNSIDYPTISWDVRNEVHSFTINIRTLQDERGSSDTNFARDRLENLYKVVRHRIEQNRKGATITVGSDSLKINQIYFGARTESNDRNKRLFGYKITVELKRFAVAIP
tara:strand:- start:1799 stop:2368 length:570 start_codon:yes stop_codon:yes gene_type:complete